MLSSILANYQISNFTAEPLVSGLINRTWKISTTEGAYVLQRVNQSVFQKPWKLAENLRKLKTFLSEHHPEYLFVAPLTTHEGLDLVVNDDGYFRLLPFVEGSHTISVVTSPEQAHQAAYQFGKFTELLSPFDASSLHFTIPDFHNLALRHDQFEQAVSMGNTERILSCQSVIDELKKRYPIVQKFIDLRHSDARIRVMHHDTKISNVLFDENDRGLCVIDLDTVMPGYFISDVGDMMRTYLSSASEEVKDMGEINVREDYFGAIVQGYLEAMHAELSDFEKSLFCYSGLFLIYMQALRFLADHCNNDVYYGASYEGHNYFRALNQLTLLQRFEEKLPRLEEIVKTEAFGRKYY